MTSQTDNASTGSINRILLLAALLALVAAIPRLYNLGDLGFYMDEETTAFASRSLAETGESRMPSGMPYYRALPLTWLNSVSARIFGLDKEFSYRLPSALFGILTVPLIFVLARPYVGMPVAFLAALLLSFSEWHIITSRQARMYAPFLFFYIALAFSILQWARKDTLRNLSISIALFIATISLHQLGIFAAFIPLIALFIKDYATTPQYKLIIFAVISGIAAYLAGDIFIESAYRGWKEAHSIPGVDFSAGRSIYQNLSITGVLAAQGISGSLLGVWLAIKSRFPDPYNGRVFRILVRYALAILCGGLAATGNIHGAFLSLLLLLLLHPASLYHYLQRTWVPLSVIALVAIFTAFSTITDFGLMPGIKKLLSFPYPNWITLYSISSGITLLFMAVMLYLAAAKQRGCDTSVLVLLIIGLLPIILVGIVMKWAAARYLLQAYPFVLILSAYVLYTFIHYLIQTRYTDAGIPTIVIAGTIVLSGVLGGHGLLPAYKSGTVDYGDRLNETALIFPVYPDHKFPGEYVAAHRAPGDIVVAEDVLEQRWYAGKVDYWLRTYGSEEGSLFSYKGKDGNLHDIYVNSIILTPDMLQSLAGNRIDRVWIITSGETYFQREFYLKDDQRQWLENIESSHKPVFTGKDGITKVYCLNCSTTY